jgi:hypothetical protein
MHDWLSVVKKNYSDFRLFTGLAIAAFIAWKLMVNKATNMANRQATKKIHQLMPILYVKSCSQLCISIQVIGAAIKKEISTSIKKSRDNRLTITPTDAPITFLIPISFVRWIVL